MKKYFQYFLAKQLSKLCKFYKSPEKLYENKIQTFYIVKNTLYKTNDTKLIKSDKLSMYLR